MADGVARSPPRLCSRDEKISCYGDAMSTIFLLDCFFLCLASYFSFFVFLFLLFLFFFLHPGMFTLFVSLRLCSSHLRLSASTYYFYNTCSFCLCHLHPTPSRNSMVFFYSSSIFFRSSYFSGDVFFHCALVPGTLALDLPTLILKRLVFLCLTVTTEFVSL